MAKTVLVADDNPGVRKALCKLFQMEKDYEVCAEASNGEEVIALAKKHKPDLIILDLSMPGMHGLDAAAELKKIMPEIPIILFTVHAETLKDKIAQPPIDMIVSKSDANLMNHVRTLVPVEKASL